ncbi:hypothetical protein AOLI_G00191960 [Acnodon oligacanthus]
MQTKASTSQSIMSRREPFWIYSSLNNCFFMVLLVLLIHLIIVDDVRAAGQDKVETIEVKEGVNVTLRTNLTGIKADDIIQWMFVGTRIAQLVNTDTVKYFEETFKNRLKLDKQTGSLTISNIRTTDSGDYAQQLISEKTSVKQFSVTVYAPVPVPALEYGFRQNQSGSNMQSNPNCSMVCSVRNAFKVTLSWFRGSQLLSNISDSYNSTLSLPLEIKHNDNDTYICVAANPISNQTVLVKRTCTQNASTIGNETPPPSADKSPQHLWLIPVLIVLLLVSVVMYVVHRKFCKGKQKGPSKTES